MIEAESKIAIKKGVRGYWQNEFEQF